MTQYGKSGGLLYRKTLTDKNVLKLYINDPVWEVGGELLYRKTLIKKMYWETIEMTQYGKSGEESFI